MPSRHRGRPNVRLGVLSQPKSGLSRPNLEHLECDLTDSHSHSVLLCTRFIGVLLLSLRRCLVLRNFCALGRLLPLQGLPRHSSLTFQALYIICNPSTKANDMILIHWRVRGFATSPARAPANACRAAPARSTRSPATTDPRRRRSASSSAAFGHPGRLHASPSGSLA